MGYNNFRVLGDRFTSHEVVDTFGDEEICSHENCNVKLSRYNQNIYCSQHEKLHPENYKQTDRDRNIVFKKGRKNNAVRSR